MIVRMIIAVGVLLLMCAIMAVLARRLRGVPPTRLLINLLFPFSQLCIVAFLFYYAIAYELPFWMFALVAVVGALCGPVDLVLFKALEESEKRELSRERVRVCWKSSCKRRNSICGVYRRTSMKRAAFAKTSHAS